MAKNKSKKKKDMLVEELEQVRNNHHNDNYYHHTKKKIPDTDERTGKEILNGIFDKVDVVYGEKITKNESDKQDSLNSIRVMFSMFEKLHPLLEENKVSEGFYNEIDKSDTQTIKVIKSSMRCKGKTTNLLVKEGFVLNKKKEGAKKQSVRKYDLKYINPVLIQMQKKKWVDTFRQKPDQKTVNDLDDANERKKRIERKKKPSPQDKFELERIEKILKKKNEDKHDLHVFLTDAGATEYQKYKDGIVDAPKILKLLDRWVQPYADFTDQSWDEIEY